MQNCVQTKESKCGKDKLKCAPISMVIGPISALCKELFQKSYPLKNGVDPDQLASDEIQISWLLMKQADQDPHLFLHMRNPY